MNLRQFFTTQTWWGKLIGAFLGYLMAGPVGALFGILIGNFFDRGLSDHFSRPFWFYHTEQRTTVQKIFFEATFSIMGYIAKSDGRVSEQEIQVAKELMKEMRLRSSQRRQAIEYFNQGKQPDFNLNRILTLLREVCRDNAELLQLFIDIQYRAAQADGLSDKKMHSINTIFRSLGFAPLNQQYRFYEDFVYRYTTSNQDTHQDSGHQSSSYQKRSYYGGASSHSLDHAFAILEINPTSNKQEVKRAYRRLMSKHHPDKLIAQGLSEEMIKLANNKTQKIRKAYEQICESKGW